MRNNMGALHTFEGARMKVSVIGEDSNRCVITIPGVHSLYMIYGDVQSKVGGFIETKICRKGHFSKFCLKFTMEVGQI